MTAYKDKKLILERFEVGPYLVNTYILGCLNTGQGAIIDPGYAGEMLLQRCRELGLTVQYILNTHGHIDHILENGLIKQETGARIVIHPADASMLTNPHHNLSAYFTEAIVTPPADLFFEEGRTFRLGELDFQVLHTPGHSPGSVCLVHDPIAIVGDVLFHDSVGRSDFPGGSHEMLLRNIREKLLPLGDHMRVFSGHGPDTTLGRERAENPFLIESGY